MFAGTRAGAMVLVAVVCGCPLMADARVFGGKGEDTFSYWHNARPLSETEMETYLVDAVALNPTRAHYYTPTSRPGTNKQKVVMVLLCRAVMVRAHSKNELTGSAFLNPWRCGCSR